MALKPFSLIDGNTAAEHLFKSGTWKLTVDQQHWICASPRFGSVEYAVTTDQHGKPAWDRPVYREASHIITVPWYKPTFGPLEIGLIMEERIHGGGKFWGVPRGFLNAGEKPEDAARREAGEEAGARVVRSARYLGPLNPNPTFVATTGPVIALEVDKNHLSKIAPDRQEKIYRVEFFDRKKLNRAIVAGLYQEGKFSDGVSLGALAKFFAWFDTEM
jgi:8-oxo-dGTP pyrophosphatase MutT (NUDIX family)